MQRLLVIISDEFSQERLQSRKDWLKGNVLEALPMLVRKEKEMKDKIVTKKNVSIFTEGITL